MKSLSQIKGIIWKDIVSEIRTRESLPAILAFTLIVIVIFNFAFSNDEATIKLVAPGILWVAFTFSGMLSLNRAFVMEKEGGCIEGLMACPISREAIYLGKMLGILLFMVIIEAVTLAVFALWYNLPVLSAEVILITFLTTLGFVAIGTTFSAMAVNTRARETVLSILFLPVVSPIIISAVEASRLALSGGTWGDIATWLEVIAAFDVIVLTASYLVFTFVIEE
jgi:heme exporter protein B